MRQPPKPYQPREIRQKKLRPEMLALLQRFAEGREQIGFQTGTARGLSLRLYKRGYLFVVEEHGKWRRYDITQAGREALAQALAQQAQKEVRS